MTVATIAMPAVAAALAILAPSPEVAYHLFVSVCGLLGGLGFGAAIRRVSDAP